MTAEQAQALRPGDRVRVHGDDHAHGTISATTKSLITVAWRNGSYELLSIANMQDIEPDPEGERKEAERGTRAPPLQK
jgi:hypothetical protein